MEIQFTTQIFKEGRTFVAHTPEVDVSSCGGTKEKSLKNLKKAVGLFLAPAVQFDLSTGRNKQNSYIMFYGRNNRSSAAGVGGASVSVYPKNGS